MLYVIIIGNLKDISYWYFQYNKLIIKYLHLIGRLLFFPSGLVLELNLTVTWNYKYNINLIKKKFQQCMADDKSYTHVIIKFLMKTVFCIFHCVHIWKQTFTNIFKFIVAVTDSRKAMVLERCLFMSPIVSNSQ